MYPKIPHIEDLLFKNIAVRYCLLKQTLMRLFFVLLLPKDLKQSVLEESIPKGFR